MEPLIFQQLPFARLPPFKASITLLVHLLRSPFRFSSKVSRLPPNFEIAATPCSVGAFPFPGNAVFRGLPRVFRERFSSENDIGGDSMNS